MIVAGQTIVWGLKTYDSTGALADVGTGPTATVTRPDNTTGSATVTKTATGTYTATFASTVVGRYRVLWSGSGVNSGGLPYADARDVVDTNPRLIIPLAEARARLNLPAAAVSNDDELLTYVAAATMVIEHLAGPQLAASVVEYHDGGARPALALHKPATAITSVVEDGVTLAATDYCLGAGSVLYRGSTPGASAWAAGAQNVTVTYSVGASAIDPNVLLAASELVRFWYASSQQGNRPQLQPEAPTWMVSGYAVPHAVADKLKASDRRVPGIA